MLKCCVAVLCCEFVARRRRRRRRRRTRGAGSEASHGERTEAERAAAEPGAHALLAAAFAAADAPVLVRGLGRWVEAARRHVPPPWIAPCRRLARRTALATCLEPVRIHPYHCCLAAALKDPPPVYSIAVFVTRGALGACAPHTAANKGRPVPAAASPAHTRAPPRRAAC